MPREKIVKVFDFDGEIKTYKIRGYLPQNISVKFNDLVNQELSNEANNYLLQEMVLDPKITKEFLESYDCDAKEMEQLLIEIMKSIDRWIDPADLIGKSKEEAQMIMYRNSHKRELELKKKLSLP